MKRVKNILTTKEEVAKVRQALEDKTREAFDRFDKARQACARQWMIACAWPTRMAGDLLPGSR